MLAGRRAGSGCNMAVNQGRRGGRQAAQIGHASAGTQGRLEAPAHVQRLAQGGGGGQHQPQAVEVRTPIHGTAEHPELLGGGEEVFAGE